MKGKNVCAFTKKSQAAREKLLPDCWRYILKRDSSYSVNAASSAARIMASRSASDDWADAASPAGFAARERRRRRGLPVAASVSSSVRGGCGRRVWGFFASGSDAGCCASGSAAGAVFNASVTDFAERLRLRRRRGLAAGVSLPSLNSEATGASAAVSSTGASCSVRLGLLPLPCYLVRMSSISSICGSAKASSASIAVRCSLAWNTLSRNKGSRRNFVRASLAAIC